VAVFIELKTGKSVTEEEIMNTAANTSPASKFRAGLCS
jgi:hypothetical protein